MKPRNLSIEEISVGDSVEFERAWNDADVSGFARISGDMNPLHVDEEYARKTKFKRRVVHGMLAASAFSALVGMYLPGRRCLYIKQTLRFRKPIFLGDRVKVCGTVNTISRATGLLGIAVSIIKGTEVAVEGLATVQVLPKTD